MMAKFSCFSSLVGKKKKSKVDACNKDHGTLPVKLEHPIDTSKGDQSNSTSVDESAPCVIQESSTSVDESAPCGIQESSTTGKVKLVSNDVILEGPEPEELAYEGSDEPDESHSIRREFSDFDLQARVPGKDDDVGQFVNTLGISGDSIEIETNGNRSEREEGSVQCGHLSDPGIDRTSFWGSPKLQRSCSNLETKSVLKIANQLPPSKSQSFEDLQNLTGNDEIQENQSSPLSVMTSCSADRVMLKKKSSSQVLPSKSRRLWWKLFLWSHRNLHKPSTSKEKQLSVIRELSNRKEGYSSDTFEPSRALDLRKNSAKISLNLDSPELFSSESKDNITTSSNNQNWNNLLPQNQWVAFSTETNLTRIDEWVNSLEMQPIDDDGYEGETSHDIIFPPSPENGGAAEKNPHIMRRHNSTLVEELLQANNVTQSLNSFSAVAHIAGMGLKVIPAISHFSSLRSVNLSGNFIVHITPGSLPKSLHTLNLSRNKIVTIEGLRELTRLRVLDLSYNRIARIGQGLSNCTIIKELYLAGNKISDVEGLHRLLKLTVLDLSFNKITTAKALGQLVANYNSLLALNLLGNPIQSNIGDDQLRKAVLSLLPKLAYLNKQPIKPQRAREAATDRVAKAALGNSGWNPRKKTQKRAAHGSSSTSKSRGQTGGHKNRHRSKRPSAFA